MTYDEYIHSARPLRVSAILFLVVLLLPIATFAFEGWHSGVAYGFAIALAVGFLIPGIYLLRPSALFTWAFLAAVTSLFVTLTIEHYSRAVPDWMDARIPDAVMATLNIAMRLIEASMAVLGIWGWVRYIRINETDHSNA